MEQDWAYIERLYCEEIPQKHRSLVEALYDRICRVDLIGEPHPKPDLKCRPRDSQYWLDQVKLYKSKLHDCLIRSEPLIQHGIHPKQPKPMGIINSDDTPEAFYHALPTQPPSPTLSNSRRRTTIPRIRRFRKLLKRKDTFRSNVKLEMGNGSGVLVTPAYMDWPVDWTQVYEEDVRAKYSLLIHNASIPEPDYQIQELEYWQKLSRQYNEEALRQFFFPRQHVEQARSEGKCMQSRQRRQANESISGRLRSRDVESGPISSRLRSRSFTASRITTAKVYEKQSRS
ncbi:MAG: hypothetical protein M1836_002677 [Candelina mexicana]|nr:MAG: hypothetical protein M1836_002677 [Candelina mexicana]